MKKKGWLKHLALLMALVLTMSVMQAGEVFASEGEGAAESAAEETKIILTSFEELKALEEAAANGLNKYPVGTPAEELGLPVSLKAYDEQANEYELKELEWTLRLKEDEEKLAEILEKIKANGEEALDEESRKFLKDLEEKEKEPEDKNAKKPNEYDPETTPAGEYVFTMVLEKEYALGEDAELPKVFIIIEEVEMMTEAATEVETEAPTEAMTEAPTEAMTEAPTEVVTEAATEVETEAPTEAVTEAATEVETEAPTEAVTEAATEAVTEAPTEVETEAATEAVTEAATEAVTEAATEAVTEAATEAVTEAATEAVTEAPTEAVTEVPTEAVTEAATEAVTEVPTEAVTEAPTEAVTEAPTEVETEAPTEVMTEAPTEEPVTERETTANESEPILSKEADILEFRIGEHVAVFEESESVITLECYADLTKVVPTIKISEKATLAIVLSDNTKQPYTEGMSFDFSDGKKIIFEVTSEDGSISMRVFVKVIKAEHIPGEWTVVKAPTCVDEGEKVQNCTVEGCGVLLNKEVIPASGHTLGEWVVATAPTCITEGQKVQYCTVEGCKILVNTEVIPATGHTLKEKWEVTVEATCTEDGEKVQKCSVCDEIVNTEVIEALGHNPRKKWEITLEPDCTNDGERIKTCKRCEEIVETEVLKALGHDWGTGTAPDADDAKEGWSVTLQPTTSSKGKMERSCKRSGCGVVETKEIQRLNIIAQAGNNTIWGLSNDATYPINSVITFKAIGDCMDNTAPISGDVRYVPSSTWKLVNDYSWSNSDYTASFRVIKEGEFTLTVVFVKQIHDGTQWVNTQETSVVERKFVIAGEGEFTDENGNGTGNTKNPDEVIGAVQTGDNNPIILLSAALAAAVAILIVLLVVRRKKNTK